ncbi:MAG TPA: GNAT family N-acetyltransferase [Acidobacteriota bacterium]|nr:GNAT family N-acetyltransferase [Acidobacteriota bacterium]
MSSSKKLKVLERILTRHDLSIRPDMRKSDPESVRQLMLESFKAYDLNSLVIWYGRNPESFLKEYVGANQERRVGRIIEDKRRNVVGSGCIIQHCAKKPDLAELSKVYIDPKYQGRGIGKALVTYLLTHAKSQGFTSVYLSTRIEFAIALRMYEHMGFVRIPHPYYSSPKSVAMQLDL